MSHRQRRIFFQFFITTVWLLIFDVPFVTLMFIPNPTSLYGFVVTLLYTINCSINGWVYLTLNKPIRRGILSVYGFRRKEAPLNSSDRLNDRDRESSVQLIRQFCLNRLYHRYLDIFLSIEYEISLLDVVFQSNTFYFIGRYQNLIGNVRYEGTIL